MKFKNFWKSFFSTFRVKSLWRESDRLDVVVELERSVDLDQADVVHDDAGVVILKIK